METAEVYIARATEFNLRAQQTTNPVNRDMFAQMAERYLQLAREATAKASPVEKPKLRVVGSS